MKPITILLPEKTPMIAIAKFAHELACTADLNPETLAWTFTQARDPLPPVDTQALKDELNDIRRKYVELSKAVNDVISTRKKIIEAEIFMSGNQL